LVNELPLGLVAVKFGDPKDPERIKNMLGNFSAMNFYPERFPEIDAWPEGEEEKAFLAINLDETFANIEAKNQRLLEMGYPLLGFPELAALATDENWAETVGQLAERGIGLLEATLPMSFFVWTAGAVLVPLLALKKDEGWRLSGHNVRIPRDSSYWTLVGERQ
jgi:hypothetical protein